jgi:hypothetical protein
MDKTYKTNISSYNLINIINGEPNNYDKIKSNLKHYLNLPKNIIGDNNIELKKDSIDLNI